MLVQMLNDEGVVTGTHEAHECRGGDGCESPAVCEDHANCVASAENPVVVWSDADGMTFVACHRALATDDFARLLQG